jgi:hypothetical protein
VTPRTNFAWTDRQFCKRYLAISAACLFAQMLTAGAVFGPVLTQGPVVGSITASEAKVFVRTDQAATVTLRYGTDPLTDTKRARLDSFRLIPGHETAEQELHSFPQKVFS